MKTLKLFLAIWTLVMLAACQTETVEPVDPIDPRSTEVESGDVFYRDFILDITVKGTRVRIDPLASEFDDDPHSGELTGCLGISDVVAVGYGTYENEVYAARTNFEFEAKTRHAEGRVKLEFENPSKAYVFELMGDAYMRDGYHTSDKIIFPVKLVYATIAHKGKFVGYLYIDDPDVLHCISEDVVRVPAHIRGSFFPLN